MAFWKVVQEGEQAGSGGGGMIHTHGGGLRIAPGLWHLGLFGDCVPLGCMTLWWGIWGEGEGGRIREGHQHGSAGSIRTWDHWPC